MSPLMMLLSFMLPMLTAAIQAADGASIHTLFPSPPPGDVLNITQCYCQSPDPLGPNATFGYYYLYDYYNFHLNRSFAIAANCTSPAPDNSFNKKADECMDHISKQKKNCRVDPDGNKFCFKFKEKAEGILYLPSASKYYFGGQKRRVPAQPSDFLAEDAVTEDCDIYCDKGLGGLMSIKTSSTLIPGAGTVTNKIVSYSDLDDMCSTCA